MNVQINAVPGTQGFERGTPPWWKRFGASGYNDWSSFLFWRVNWSDFVLIHLGGEIAWHMGTAELDLALLGLHAQFTYYWPNELREDLKRTARLLDVGMLETIPLDEVLNRAHEEGETRSPHR